MAEPADLGKIADEALANVLALVKASDRKDEILSGLKEIAKFLTTPEEPKDGH